MAAVLMLRGTCETAALSPLGVLLGKGEGDLASPPGLSSGTTIQCLLSFLMPLSLTLSWEVSDFLPSAPLQ